MLTMIHNNPVRIASGRLQVDRKFHSGMQKYVGAINAPILSVHPQAQPGQSVMDLVDVPLDELGYEIVALELDAAGRPSADSQARLQDAIRRSRLVYGYGYQAPQTARRLGVPYILLLEYDLQTQLTVTTSSVSSPLRKAVRSLRTTWKYARWDIPAMRHAHSLHCNGYPIYDETRHFNDQRLLYLDSRMSTEMVITAEELEARLAVPPRGRPLKLLFSGRYLPLKGSLDAVQVAVECLRQGLDVEMHCYGQGSLAGEMRALAASAPGAPGRIQVHDAIPYPELVIRSKSFDAFVCCHIQGDPSCTYLESFGAGLPIVGYGNRMWRRLAETSQAGDWSPMKQPLAVANDVRRLIEGADRLPTLSRRAREFALAHAYEHEFDLRINALNAALAG